MFTDPAKAINIYKYCDESIRTEQNKPGSQKRSEHGGDFGIPLATLLIKLSPY